MQEDEHGRAQDVHGWRCADEIFARARSEDGGAQCAFCLSIFARMCFAHVLFAMRAFFGALLRMHFVKVEARGACSDDGGSRCALNVEAEA